MNWIDCRVRLPDIDDNVLIYNNNTKGQLVGVYLGNGQIQYATTIIPASRVKHLKILLLEEYRASNKSKSKDTLCTSIDSDCIAIAINKWTKLLLMDGVIYGA